MFSFVKDVVNTSKVLHKLNYIQVVYKITYNYLSGQLIGERSVIYWVSSVNNW